MCHSIPPPVEAKDDDPENPPSSEPNPDSKAETLDLSHLFTDESSVDGCFALNDVPVPLAVAPPTGDVIYYCNPDNGSSYLASTTEDVCKPLPSWDSWREYAEKPQLWDPEQDWLVPSDPTPAPSNEISISRVGAGLSNLGNTCFLNAILQCLTHTVPLVRGLRSCNHSASSHGDSNGFCVICTLCEQIECSLASSGGTLSPLKLVDNLSYFSSSFRRYQQEDAHEFMQCALDKLDRCFIDLKNNNKSFEGFNLVEKTFGGRLISKLRCCNCGHSSNTYEPLIDMSLEIENADTLPSALESFTKVECIEANFKCDSCKKEVSLEKQLLLDQTPSVAAFHLKRFKTDGISVQKIDKHVNFPLELDLQPYSICDQDNNVPLKYDLYAVVVHIGYSATSGHYFCYVRSAPDTWHKLDDSKVTVVSADSVLSQEAYILFYAQQGTPWFSSIMESIPCLDLPILNTSPKSVLDMDVISDKSNSTVTANIASVEGNESKKNSEQQFDCSSKEKNDLPEVNDTGDASHACKQFPSGPNQDSVGLNASKDTIQAYVPPGDNAILNFSAVCMLDVNSLFEIDGSDKNKCSEDFVGFGENNNGFHPLTPPISPAFPDYPDMGYQIPRDHLKMENHGSCKKLKNKHMEDSERKAATSYVNKMPSSRRQVFMDLVSCSAEGSSNKKRKDMDSSQCKKGSSHSVPKKSNHSSVMHPVVTGISQ